MRVYLPLLTLVAACAGNSEETPENEISTLAGDISLTVGSGPTCTTTLQFDGVQDDSIPWTCPSCVTIYRAPLVETGNCLNQGADVVLLGWDAGGTLYFSNIGYGPMQPFGTVSEEGTTAELVIDVPPDLNEPGSGFTGSATLTTGTETGDPLWGLTPPDTYACGWPSGEAPALSGTYPAAEGTVVPDGVFYDDCGEPVRLHDLAGGYLVLQMNQTEDSCPPCIDAANQQPAFETRMANAGLDVTVATFLVPHFFEYGKTVSPAAAEAFATTYGIAGPAFADRGYGATVINRLASDGSDAVAYPSYALVGPDGTFVDGFAGAQFTAIGDAIEALEAR